MSATRLDNLRQEAYAATRGLAAGQQALVDALRDLQLEKGRAADGYRAVVQSLAAALEARDGYTSGHSDEVQRLAVAVAERLGLSDDERAEVQAVAILHDIGKIGIPDRILHKPGKLTEEDWVLMRQHPVIGERILRPVPGLAGAARAVRHEHERWDGGGYPDGLAADAIPLASRIVLACDAWHAMVSDRPYRRALDRDGARDEMRTCAGSQFDPQVVVVLLACLDAPAFAGPPPDWTGGAGGGAVAAEMLTLERELRALLMIAASVAGADELHDVLDLIADEALGAMGADSLSISRWEAAGEHLRTLLNAGELGGLEERRPAAEIYRLAPDDGLRRSLLEGRPYLGSLDDPDLHPLERELLESTGKHSCAAVPIMFAGQPWGEMWVTRRAGRPVFGAHDVRFLQAIAAQVATAIGRAEMFTRMAALAMRDELTGLANRRALDERLELVVEAALRGKGSVTLVLCDLDRLKELNDIQGHEAGDAALRRTADVLTELVASQPRALVARLGGDEMCLLLEGVEATEAQELAEMALARLGAGEPPLGLSCGIAAVRLGIESPSDLLRAADSALYVAKRSGRGRVCVADNHPRQAWRDGAPRQNGRRALRDHGDLDVAALLTDALQDLDGPMAARPTVERLGSLAMACAAAVDATAAGISLQRAGEPDLHTLLSFDRRSGQTGGVATHAEEERYVVADYPGTEALLEHGGSVLWRAADPAVDPAELALLAEWGYAAVLAVSARGSEGAWLLEIYADELTGDLASLEPLARVLAVHGVHGGTPEARSRSRAIRAAARADTLA